MMTKNTRILASFIIAFILGLPLKWIQYKGEGISFLKVFEIGIQGILFNVLYLILDTIIIYVIWSSILKYKNRN